MPAPAAILINPHHFIQHILMIMTHISATWCYVQMKPVLVRWWPSKMTLFKMKRLWSSVTTRPNQFIGDGQHYAFATIKLLSIVLEERIMETHITSRIITGIRYITRLHRKWLWLVTVFRMNCQMTTFIIIMPKQWGTVAAVEAAAAAAAAALMSGVEPRYAH